jgi:thiol-disulfide isomerase/thioredoxin
MKATWIAVVAAIALVSPITASVQSPQSDDSPTFSTDDIDRSTPPPAAPPSPDGAKTAGTVARRAGGIAWRRSFEEARRTAKGSQFIVVDVYTDWCGVCKFMDKKIYTDQAIVDFSAGHVFVRLNAEDGAEGEQFASRTGVRGYPTTLVYASDGRLVTRMAGAFRRPEAFLEWLTEATAGG